MRYQECNIFIRLYRRLKYQPLYFIKACIAVIRELPYNSQLPSRFGFLCVYNQWYIKANWYYTHEEVFRTITPTSEDHDLSCLDISKVGGVGGSGTVSDATPTEYGGSHPEVFISGNEVENKEKE